MRKILDWLKKFNTPLYYGVVCLCVGIAFIVLPFIKPILLDILLVIAGVCSIAIGVLTVVELETPDRSPRYYLNVGRTLALIGFGIFLIFSRGALARNICLVFGVYMLVRAIPMLVRLVTLPERSEKSWWIRLVLSILEILLGLWLVFYPVYPNILAGATLVIVAIDLFIKHYKGKGKGGGSSSGGTIYDPHFVDRS